MKERQDEFSCLSHLLQFTRKPQELT